MENLRNRITIENRDVTIDMLKSIAIILVVLGHVIQIIYSPESYDRNWIFKIIYSFHMPLFIFISGYLIGFKKKLTLKWLLNRGLRLAVPFIVWIPIDYLLDGGRSFDGLILVFQRLYKDPSAGGLWFLWVLFLCCVILFLVENVNSKILKGMPKNSIRYAGIKEILIEFVLVILELLFLIGIWFVTGFTTTLGLRLCCKEIIFFLMGFYINKIFQVQKDNEILLDKKSQLFFYILFPCLVIFWDRTHFVTFYEILNTWVESNRFLKILILLLEVTYYYFVSFLGIGFVWNLVKKIKGRKLTRGLAAIGRYTMEIYILHMYFFVYCFEHRSINTILSLVLGVSLPLLVGKMAEKKRHLRLVLFGK